MRLTTRRLSIPDVIVIEHEVFTDDRGFFMEVFKRDQFGELGFPSTFPQINLSRSARNVVRGLHFQWEPPMGKLMRVAEGTAFLVAVDIRKGSPTLGEWVGETFSADSHRQLWAPPGFARGFCVLSSVAQIEYLCTAEYNPTGESGIRWNDPRVGIEWPVTAPILSGKDVSAQTLDEWLARPESDNFASSSVSHA
jgi:dTDP-4-dehydrorhamnose 3,5-epimerase